MAGAASGGYSGWRGFFRGAAGAWIPRCGPTGPVFRYWWVAAYTRDPDRVMASKALVVRSLALCLVAAVSVAPSCHRGAAVPASDQAQTGSGQRLPDIPGFSGGPQEAGPGFLRRSYTHASETITVTLARFPMTAAQYQEWLRASTGSFPQADLGIEPSQGNGFYQCAPEDPSRCNLLVQLRCGIHLELRGPTVARRRDADAISQGLALPSLVRACDGQEP